jgi:hypothetical protein
MIFQRVRNTQVVIPPMKIQFPTFETHRRFNSVGVLVIGLINPAHRKSCGGQKNLLVTLRRSLALSNFLSYGERISLSAEILISSDVNALSSEKWAWLASAVRRIAIQIINPAPPSSRQQFAHYRTSEYLSRPIIDSCGMSVVIREISPTERCVLVWYKARGSTCSISTNCTDGSHDCRMSKSNTRFTMPDEVEPFAHLI